MLINSLKVSKRFGTVKQYDEFGYLILLINYYSSYCFKVPNLFDTFNEALPFPATPWNKEKISTTKTSIKKKFKKKQLK